MRAEERKPCNQARCGQRDPPALLADIRDGCKRVARLISERSLDDYKEDETLRLACERVLGLR